MPHYSDNTDNLSDHSLLRLLGVSFVFSVYLFLDILAGRQSFATLSRWTRPEIFSLFGLDWLVLSGARYYHGVNCAASVQLSVISTRTGFNQQTLIPDGR